MVNVQDPVRFEFGQNWSKFLASIDADRINKAEASLQSMLNRSTLEGNTFLDIGSGSGLFSLAARRLGARVHSFDYDAASVSCTAGVKQKYYPDDPHWIVEQGSILDHDFLRHLPAFDVVYSWGVLHHTGNMWQALENVIPLVAPGGKLFIAIYNDQGRATRVWAKVKHLYVSLPPKLRLLVLAPAWAWLWLPPLIRDIFILRPFQSWRQYTYRGMHPWRDLVDWVGGYPFEVATPKQIFSFYRGRGFHLDYLETRGGGLGCNEFVFTRSA